MRARRAPLQPGHPRSLRNIAGEPAYAPPVRRRDCIGAILVLGATWPAASASAVDEPTLDWLGPETGNRGRFRLTNPSPDTLVFTTYDGGNVHNQLERRDASGAWSRVGMGFCGLGRDGEVRVRPGATQIVRGYVGETPGMRRIVLEVEVRGAGARRSIEIVSAPFTG
jgi:hypothetical protein